MAGAKKRAKKPVGRDRVLFNILSYAVLTALSAACLLPFLLVLSGSVSEQYSIQLHGYRLFPETISLDAYKMLFRIPQELLRAYGVTIFVTAVGTVLGLWLTSMAAYVLSSRDFRYRYQVSFFFYFTSIFGGGLVPWYIFNTKYLHFHNSVIALILPILINVTYLLILKSYMTSIPEALYESAKLDGAGDFTIYFRFALPLCKAGLATVGLFIALNYWNDWYNAVSGRGQPEPVPAAIRPEQYYDQCAGDERRRRAQRHPRQRRAQRTDEAGDDGGRHRSDHPFVSVPAKIFRQGRYHRSGKGITGGTEKIRKNFE